MEEPDIVIYANGACISLHAVDRLLTKVFEANRGRYPINTFTVISHPSQADGLRTLLAELSPEYREDSYILQTNPFTRPKQWLELTDFPEDEVRVESPSAAGVIRQLSLLS